jgi:hypothetical protein
MVEVPKVAWSTLAQAYGSAENIPALLVRAETDTRGGHVQGSTWFDLWSALCHQGDSYTGSYAAVPHLVQLAERPAYRIQYDPLFLAACIDLSRLEGCGPDLPDDLVVLYRAALRRGLELATAALESATLDSDSRRVYRGCVAAFHGQSLAARNIFDDD